MLASRIRLATCGRYICTVCRQRPDHSLLIRRAYSSGSWGAPAFANTASGGSNGTVPRPSSSAPDNDLLPHEIAARTKLSQPKDKLQAQAQSASPFSRLPPDSNRRREQGLSLDQEGDTRQHGLRRGRHSGHREQREHTEPGDHGDHREHRDRRLHGHRPGDNARAGESLDAEHKARVSESPFSKVAPRSRRPAQRDTWEPRARTTGRATEGRSSAGPSRDSGGDGWGQLKRRQSEPSRVTTADDFWGQLQDRVSTPSSSRGAAAGGWSASPSRPSVVTAATAAAETTDPAEAPATWEARESKRRERARRWEFEDADGPRDAAPRRDHGAPGSRSRPARRSTEDEDDLEYDEELEEYRAEARQRDRDLRRQQKRSARAARAIFIPAYINIVDLAAALGTPKKRFLRELQRLGFDDVAEDTIMTGETAALIAQEYGFDPTVDAGELRDLKPRPPPDDPSSLPPRPPIVTIMGHVDHGKTTLLDYLRKSSVVSQEHGGITQHIGAFVVRMASSGRDVTFLDTPGHAAFLSMRQRGANCTDVVVLVVAADDSVMPQTLEALKHARAAGVPIVVAINKIDKPDARVDQVKSDLARHGVEIEDFGGDVQVVCVSGKTGQGMDALEESVVALSEVLDPRAEPDGPAEGWILEASVKPTGGKSATVLVRRGTLRPGDSIVAGTTWARVRALRNEAGVDVEEAPPGTPVEIIGWRDELPRAGDEVLQAPDEQRAKTAVEYRVEMREREQSSNDIALQLQQAREAEAAAALAAEAAEAGGEVAAAQPEAPGAKVINFIVKGDVAGSVEAVSALINETGNHEVQPRILRASAGQISESDLDRAALGGALVVNFNQVVPAAMKRLAEERGVRVLDHSVIYHLHDDVKAALSERLDDLITSRVVGDAEVAQVFPINIKGRVYRNIAGCKVRNGVLKRGDRVKILRRGKTVFDGKMESLKHGKKDAAEMRKGTDCGISFDGFQDFQVGDQVQTYEEVREKRYL